MEIQLYIQDQRVELFKDESVTITDSIQNVKDIDKVFTAFTQSFSVPASKNNNKIFKHYYNFDIIDGFDGRKKVAATIELNNLPFRTGKIKLEGVDMKNNKAHTYRITFFGDIVELKDKLGQKKLSDLDLSDYDLDYDALTIYDRLEKPESPTKHIIAPLITHSQRLFYQDGTHGEDTGNLWYESGSGTSHHHGVKYNELKYAIRVNKIIEQIETDFNLEFSSDFFKNTSIEEFNRLFMWLHRKSGRVEDLSGSTTLFETVINGWTQQEDEPFFIYQNVFESLADPDDVTEFEIQLNTTDTDSYNIEIRRDGTTVYSKSNHTGSLNVDAIAGDFVYEIGEYEVIITATTVISFSNITWSATYDTLGQPVVSVDYSTGAYDTSNNFVFNVSKQIPDMTIIDFIKGLFKTFNLTAFSEDDVIVVKPLYEFYQNPNTYDITEFIDVETSKVDVALPYNEVLFRFKDTKTFLANKFGELNNRNWGEIRYNAGSTDLAGSLYKVEAPFGHMLFERLNDAITGVQKNIQWGYSVDKSQNAYLGSPLLFYPINVNTGGISFIDAVDSDNLATSHLLITNVNLPFNSPALLASSNASQLNFNRETSEWTLDTTFSDDLFTDYYSSYIHDIFNLKTRLIKVKAYLPMRILLNYNLKDRFIIAGSQYKINSVSTNLLTGESNLELINDL